MKGNRIFVSGQFLTQLYSDEDILLQRYRLQVRAQKGDNGVHEFPTLFEITSSNQRCALRMCWGVTPRIISWFFDGESPSTMDTCEQVNKQQTKKIQYDVSLRTIQCALVSYKTFSKRTTSNRVILLQLLKFDSIIEEKL